MNLDLPSALNVVSTLAIVLALLFTGLQVREANRTRRDQASVALIQTTLNERWSHALDRIGQLQPIGTTDVGQLSDEVRYALFDFGVRLETVGYMVYRHMVPIETVDDLLGGVALMYWARAKAWVEADRVVT